MSDFKSNEYANLIGGPAYEPHEENPMIGFRGASRYLSEPSFRDCFDLECEALSFVRNEMGLTNVKLMIPFVRTLDEASGVIELLAENGLRRGENGLEVIMMCEIPVQRPAGRRVPGLLRRLLHRLQRHDPADPWPGPGFRDRRRKASMNANPAVKKLLSMAITACKARGKYVGICGQGPSDHPDLAEWLVWRRASDSISLNPDTVTDTWLRLARSGTRSAV
jgi:pyruvate,water dikinase